MLTFDLVVLGEQYFIQNENLFYFLWEPSENIILA